MAENLKRIREPLAWAVVAVVAAGLLLGVVRLVLLLTLDRVPVFEAFQDIGLSLMPLSLVLAVVALVCTCLFLTPVTPRAHLLTRVAAWVLTAGVGLTLVCMLLGVAASANAFTIVLEIFGGLLDVTIKALAAGVLWVLLRGMGAGRIDTAPAQVEAAAEETPGPPATPTVWKRQEASGAVWRTADEAAAGAPASASGSAPGGDSPAGELWRPASRPPAGEASGSQGLTKPE